LVIKRPAACRFVPLRRCLQTTHSAPIISLHHSIRTFLVRFIEGGLVECIETSRDRPGQGRVMDVS
jgi:hypothetical protein